MFKQLEFMQGRRTTAPAFCGCFKAAMTSGSKCIDRLASQGAHSIDNQSQVNHLRCFLNAEIMRFGRSSRRQPALSSSTWGRGFYLFSVANRRVGGKKMI